MVREICFVRGWKVQSCELYVCAIIKLVKVDVLGSLERRSEFSRKTEYVVIAASFLIKVY